MWSTFSGVTSWCFTKIAGGTVTVVAEARTTDRTGVEMEALVACSVGALTGAVGLSHQVGGAIGNVNRNAPYVIMQFLLVMSVFGILTTTAFVANSVHRDFERPQVEVLTDIETFTAVEVTSPPYQVHGREEKSAATGKAKR